MQYEVLVIGSGPGGYVAAIRSAQLGKKTAIIERYTTMGGTCLNVGCIPSKTLLDSSELYFTAKKHFAAHGIETGELKVNWGQMRQRKDKVISDTSRGVEFLMKKNKIDVIYGHATLIDSTTVSVTNREKKTEKISAEKIIIATGSKPSSIPNVVTDKKKIITSTEVLSLQDIPKELVVIGGGVIGVELGSVYSRLGTNVSIIEYMETLIPTMDGTLGKELLRVLKKQGIKIFLQHRVQKVSNEGDHVSVVTEDKKGKILEFKGEYCLVATGRQPYSWDLGLGNIGIATDKNGFIPVNENLETCIPGIYAIGDVIGGMMLAHKAEEEGVYVAEHIAKQQPHINYATIPGVVYTWPEVASVGSTEEQLQAENHRYKVGTFTFRALGRAKAAGEIDGLIKVLADKETDRILGIHMIGARVADMIAEAVVALEYKATAEEIGRISHAHPTFSEALKEACLAATQNRAIHM